MYKKGWISSNYMGKRKTCNTYICNKIAYKYENWNNASDGRVAE